jgi:SGNH hydrolase-like domain, acetyltransferase AlgX
MLEKIDTFERKRRGPLSRIGPAVVIGCLALDFLSRFISPGLVTFRAWEAVKLFATAQGPFAPNFTYRNARSYGDLSNMANLPQMRQYRQEVFSIDAAGYRNVHAPAQPFNGILLLGDSFAAGSGVPDEQSLGRQLARLSGLPVYNMAGGFNTPDDLRMGCGLVVWEQSERWDLTPDIDWKERLIRRLEVRTHLRIRPLAKYLYSWWAYSPVQIWAGRVIKSFQNDRFLPNPYRGMVDSRTLSNGQGMLFVPTEVQNYDRDRPTDPSYLIQMRNRLRARGIGLLVVLVPDKYVVYHDLLSPNVRPAQNPPRLFMDIVAERLSAAQIPVVNLTQPFRAEAALLLKRDSYLYWLDDTHWNAAGINRAAIEILKSGLFPKQLVCPAASNPATAVP